MARGRWTTSYRDKARAQYQADQIAQATAVNIEEIKRQAWQEGYAAGFQAGVAQAQQPPPPGYQFGGPAR